MSVSIHRHADAAVVTVAGEIDLSTAERLDREIATAISEPDTISVSVDLHAVTFMDSTGISTLLKGRRLADQHDKVYRVVGASGLVRQVLELTGVWAHLSEASG